MTIKRTTSSNPNSHALQTESTLCQFAFADGRRCRMLRRGHPSLCPVHARAEQQLLESQQLGSEISATLTGEFLTATDINFVLGKLFTAVAQNRLPARNAALLAYIGQLLLHSLSGVKNEYKFQYEFEQWQRFLARAVVLSKPSLTPLASPAVAPAGLDSSLDSSTDESHVEETIPAR
ncbi:MAG TPA: hypothetical protein VJN93_16225 [Candidatus Acidoferrum sp.]|nr:hypothetical protein [Candidatus Acidoferrum sp.]